MRTSTELIAEVIRGRRTTHLFDPQAPPRDILLRGIELARWAPNHRHTEPWRFHLLGPGTVDAIIRLNTRLVSEKKGAAAAAKKQERWSSVPGWFAVSCDRTDDDPVLQDEDYAACCCAIHNLLLFLWSEGIGAKWSTGAVTRHAEFYDLLGLARQERRIVGLFWYGYPAHIPEQRRKPVEEIVDELP